ncbi:MAG: deaminase domain-containing protein [Peptostreptococcaceae bacterium]
MTELTKLSKAKKKQRININNIIDFNKALKIEGYKEISTEEAKFKKEIIESFKIDKSVTETLYKSLSNDHITYRVDNVVDFIEYMKNINTFENEYKKLSKKINSIKKLNIARVEYDRILTTQDNVDHMLEDIEDIKNKVSRRIDEKEISILENIEKQLDEDYVFSKDIELLKKIITKDNSIIKEMYNEETRTKTITLEIPEDLNFEYIPAKLGSIEYHNHIKNNIPRMKRLRKNIKKYLMMNDKGHKNFNIDQSSTLQDTINIAVATYDNKEYKAVSGSNDVTEFCKAPEPKDTAFTSYKVNKLGKLGIGYNRVNDSEKKIFEEIHKQIQSGKIKNYGNLTLYSKWEPCPSCYHVISQFCKIHPRVNVEVKYSKKYGE